MADEDFIINIQPTPNFIVELNEQGPQGPRGPQGVQGIQGEKGDKGDTGEITVGTVITGDAGSQASVVNVGTSTDAILDFVIPRGPQGIQGIQGPPNELAIGTVEKGDNASATITGSYPDQKLNLVLPKGDRGDVGPAGTIPVGTIFSHTCSSTFVPENSLPCNGTEYSQTQFPVLWTDWLVGGRLNTCTYSQYQSDIDTYGKCGKWGLDTENGKFKTPYIPDGTHIQQAMTDGELGKSYNAGLPNITGATNQTVSGNTIDFTTEWIGAIKTDFITGTGKGLDENGWADRRLTSRISLDASHLNPTYGAANTVQTEAVSLRYFVVVATGSINQSEMDWSAWASSLQGKANVDLSNCTKPYITETYVNGTSGYRVWSDGYCEQWGRISVGPDSSVSVAFLRPFTNASYYANWLSCDGFTLSGEGTRACYSLTTTSMMIYNGQGCTMLANWYTRGY